MSPDKRNTLGSLGYTDEFSIGSGHASQDDPDPPVAKKHWGKYRGTVLDNIDLPPKGRLLVSVPGIVITNWAMPCVPAASILMGTFMRPQVGANVWVEFERGDPDKPIWVGCFWGDGQIPVHAEEFNAMPETTAMSIEVGTAGMTISDVPVAAGGGIPGSVNLFAGEGAVGIALSPGTISLAAPVVTITTGVFNVVTPAGTFTVT
jgi:hypothetical protein